jgi:aryl-alcohol dehydrogenase-like predicted oxidoreductase
MLPTRELGRTGTQVSRVGLGAMPLSLAGRPDEKDAIRVIHAALDAGMTLIDTADSYCLDERDYGHNERLIRKALAEWSGPADAILVATKGGLERPRGAWTVSARPERLKATCEAIMKVLGVDTIDLYQLHAPDDAVPWRESVGALAELQQAGKIRHVGISNVTVAELEEAREVVTVVSVQNRCNPWERYAFEDGVVGACEAYGITFLAHSPVGGHRSQGRTARDPALGAVARRRGFSPYEVALAWLLAVSPAILPIPGASRVESALSSARAAGLTLGDEDLRELRRAFPV